MPEDETKPPETKETDSPPVDEAKQESPKETEQPKYYDLTTSDGQVRQFTGQEMVELAKMGADTVLAKQKEPEEKKEEIIKEEPDASAKVDALNDKFNKWEQDQKQKEVLENYKQDLDVALDKSELLKQYPRMRRGAKILAIAEISQNHNLSIEKAVEKVMNNKLEEVKEIDEKKKHATGKVRAAVEQVQRGGGGLATMESEKPLTAEYVKTGKSKRDIQTLLEAALEET